MPGVPTLGPRFTPTCVGTTRSGRAPRGRRPVHPHVRGDDLHSPDDALHLIRFTPTCVGTTNVSCSHTPGETVHPHVRGDDESGPDTLRPATGSPPRAWGRLNAEIDSNQTDGFTPTCVGTTPCWATPLSPGAVHPHVRGDDRSSGCVPRERRGSPPRAWGRLTRSNGAAPASRFTPTCVGTTWRESGPQISLPVHPHVRGDDLLPAFLATLPVGSPPRAWGRHTTGADGAACRRFTPTCVGTTRVRRIRSPSATVHPHVRGDDRALEPPGSRVAGSPPRAWGRLHALERGTPAVTVHPHVRGDDGVDEVLARVLRGSPPRAWGRRGRCARAPGRDRFTPTCVGTTRAGWTGCSSSHGSPPRAWGRHTHDLFSQAKTRFTPTCVGTTTSTNPVTAFMAVHPHVRGDDHAPAATTGHLLGSPPRAWGRRGIITEGRLKTRFTPTCVGTTPPGRRAPGPLPVHPHVRGDDLPFAPYDAVQNGSPPRAWGRRVQPAPEQLVPRFTPTCVGTTARPSSRRSGRPVHPHVRGDDNRVPMPSGLCVGSPPRAWGRRGVGRAASANARFTPTCVGTTLCERRRRRPPSVHPHVRGDDRLAIAATGAAYGSPPRAWGRRTLSL